MVAKEAAKKKKALKAATTATGPFNRDFFEDGARVVVQDQVKKNGRSMKQSCSHVKLTWVKEHVDTTCKRTMGRHAFATPGS